MKLNLERLTVRLGLKYVTVNANRTVSLSKFRILQAFTFAYQNLPSSGTFDLSVDPF